MPIYKKDAKHLAENYRPVSLTSLVCKLIESMIKRAIMKHLATETLVAETVRFYKREVYNNTINEILGKLPRCYSQRKCCRHSLSGFCQGI